MFITFIKTSVSYIRIRVFLYQSAQKHPMRIWVCPNNFFKVDYTSFNLHNKYTLSNLDNYFLWPSSIQNWMFWPGFLIGMGCIYLNNYVLALSAFIWFFFVYPLLAFFTFRTPVLKLFSSKFFDFESADSLGPEAINPLFYSPGIFSRPNTPQTLRLLGVFFFILLQRLAYCLPPVIIIMEIFSNSLKDNTQGAYVLAAIFDLFHVNVDREEVCNAGFIRWLFLWYAPIICGYVFLVFLLFCSLNGWLSVKTNIVFNIGFFWIIYSHVYAWKYSCFFSRFSNKNGDNYMVNSLISLLPVFSWPFIEYYTNLKIPSVKVQSIVIALSGILVGIFSKLHVN